MRILKQWLFLTGYYSFEKNSFQYIVPDGNDKKDPEAKGYIKIANKKPEWVGPTSWEVGYPESLKKYLLPAISKRNLKLILK